MDLKEIRCESVDRVQLPGVGCSGGL
jgi:hypothetical protein